MDLGDVKSLVEWLVGRLGGGRVHYEPTAARPGIDHPGRTALAVATTTSGARVELGRVGELDPRYLAAYDVRAKHVVVADLGLDALAATVPASVRVGSPPRLPSMERDLAVVVAADRAAAEVEVIIRAAGGPLLREVRLFDRYQGGQVAAGEVSLGYRLRFEPADQALDDAALDSLIGGVVRDLQDHLGARLRD